MTESRSVVVGRGGVDVRTKGCAGTSGSDGNVL